MTEEQVHLAGWFGKIPNLGDFASRRLPSHFLVSWDDWLQRALVTSRAVLGSGWLDVYLTSPVWRFLLFPGVCGHVAWAGVMMPSVDRVGRYFPFTIAAEFITLPESLRELTTLAAWLHALEEVAVATLDTRYSPEQLDSALHDHPVPQYGRTGTAHLLAQRLAGYGTLTTFALPADDALSTLVTEAAIAHLLDGSGAKSLWWSRAPEGAQPSLACCDGLPAPDDFALLLEGGPIVKSTLPAPH